MKEEKQGSYGKSAGAFVFGLMTLIGLISPIRPISLIGAILFAFLAFYSYSLLKLAVGVEVGAFDVLEVAVGAYLEFSACVFIGNDEGLGVHLQGGYGPHLGDSTFNSVMQGAGLVIAIDNQKHALGIHDSAHAYGEGSLGHEIDITLEEARVGDDCVLGEGFHACARGE